MSLRLIGDLIIHLDSFRNIDLYKRGFYYYDLSLSHTQYEITYTSSPYSFFVKSPSLPKHYNNSPGLIENNSFKSKTFYVRYCDDDVSIQELVVFRFEMEFEYDQYPPLIIKAKLMYCDSSELLSDSSKFIEETSSLIQITHFSQGLSQFVPITMDRMHAAVLNSTIHVIPLDYRFRPVSLKANNRPEGYTEGIQLIELLAQFLFENELEVSDEKKRIVFDKFVKVMWNCVKKLKGFIGFWGKNIKGDEIPIVWYKEGSDRKELAQAVLDQIQVFAGILYGVEQDVLELLQDKGEEICKQLMIGYNHLMRERWGESIFRTITEVFDFTSACEEDLGKKHKKIARKVRKSEYYKTVDPLPVSVTSIFPSPKIHPIIFIDISSKVPKDKILFKETWINYLPTNTDYHLVVFVHGFQGNSLDLRSIRNQVSLIRSNTMLLCSCKNEGKTDGDIFDMGRRLAKEVLEFLSDWESSVVPVKISFIGHSMGGLIIRAALPYLQSLSDKFSFLITLSTPHLGYGYKSSTLVDAGMWFIKKFKKSLSMQQLTMSDNKTLENTCIYSLSKLEGIEWFKHLSFVSSFQDEYTPYESARVQVSTTANNDKNGVIMKKLSENLLSRVQADKIHRIDVDYKIKKKNLDTFIGRAAHIEMLDSESMINMILHSCASFFEI